MLVVYIILLLVILGFTIWEFVDDEPELGVIWFLVGIIPVVGILSLTHINTGENIYTGYVYSTENVFDKTVVHIRFSKEAGEDAQPSFCVKTSNELSEKFKSLAGTDTKIKVKIPSGFAMNMWYGQCPIEAELIEEKENEM